MWNAISQQAWGLYVDAHGVSGGAHQAEMFFLHEYFIRFE